MFIELLKNIKISPIKFSNTTSPNVQVDLLRLDLIHPILSGNKLFKLWFYLVEAQKKNLPIITYGGGYSNHLIATAFVGKYANIKTIGITNTTTSTPILEECKTLGMRLKPVSHDFYKSIKYQSNLKHLRAVIIPEGGFSPLGVAGASLINNFFSHKHYTHIAIGVGSTTTLAGLLKHNSNPTAKFIVVPAIKNMVDIEQRLEFLQVHLKQKQQLLIKNQFHFGGFAKYNTDLINFIKEFKQLNNVELDIVYTGKLMYSIKEMIKNNTFSQTDKILCIHSGGLTGNGKVV